LKKSNFAITEYLAKNKKFGDFWKMLYNEAKLTEKYCLMISNQKVLLENDPIVAKSIELREKLILPLLIIQQYALTQINKTSQKEKKQFYKKLLLKTMAANTNASRNSA
jgi:phosphoenolpyruvate carboxylase